MYRTFLLSISTGYVLLRSSIIDACLDIELNLARQISIIARSAIAD